MQSPQLGPRRLVYEDRYRQIHRVTADFGHFTKEYLVMESGQRAALVSVREDSVLLVRQYRLLIDGLSWEVPGGRVDEGETPEVAAIRECLEETGLLCRDLKPLLVFQAGLDAFHNPTHLFYSKEWEVKAIPDPNPAEVVAQEWVPLERCVDMVFRGQIVDSLSIVAILAYQTFNSRS
jgi:ADP-ribose pyrophosphatase